MATQLLTYDLADDLETGLSKALERISALESAVYKPTHLEAVPTREERLDTAATAIRRGIDIFLDLGVIDADVLGTSIVRPLIDERIAVAENEGRL